ncbi:hypothetical protein FHX95_002030 [Clostridium saccharobutylicum]|nr:hypothetical protein [Clostridium saccharobutylicum]NYC30580.1 hypothetical protein [Clostridium saccharobutylicum]
MVTNRKKGCSVAMVTREKDSGFLTAEVVLYFV